MKGFARFLIIFFILIVISYFVFRSCFLGPSANKIVANDKKFKVDTSQLILPIEMDIASFQPTLNKNLEDPEWFYEENGIEVNKQLEISYRVRKDGMAQLYPQNNKIMLQVPLYIDIKPKITGPGGIKIAKKMEMETRLILNSEIDVDLLPNWDLETKANSNFEVVESPKINIAGFDISFEKQLLASLDEGLDELNQMIESQVQEAINTKYIVDLIWDQIETPYHVETDLTDVWLITKPYYIEASDIQPVGPGILGTTFYVKATIDVKTGKRPVTINTKAIPDAIRVSQITEKNTELYIPLTIPNQEIKKLLEQYNEPISFPIAGNQSAEFSNFSVDIVNQMLELKSDFSTIGAQGEITVIAIPTFDERTQTIGVSIQSIQAKSNNVVVNELLNGMSNSSQVKKEIEKRAKYSLKENFNDFSTTATKQLKTADMHEYVEFDGEVKEIKIKDIYLQNKDVILSTYILANPVCKVKGSLVSSPTS